jgi:hypothetical protein
MATKQATQTVTVIEIRARHDRNRLLGTYDPVRRLLRLFHRGQQITVNLAEVESLSALCIEPYAES